MLNINHIISSAKDYFKMDSSLFKTKYIFNKKSIGVFDIETFKNYTVICVMDKTGIRITTSRMHDFVKRTKALFNIDTTYVAFNNHSFDNIVLNNLSNNSIDNYILADITINNPIKRDYKLFKRIETIDLMGFRNSKEQYGLKVLASKTNPYRVQELPYAIDKDLNVEERNFILMYCLNDVYETHKFFLTKTEDLELRLLLFNKYKINNNKFSKYISGKNATIAEMTVENIYEQKTGELPDKITNYNLSNVCYGKDLMVDLDFKTDEFNFIYSKFKNTKLTPFNLKTALNGKVTLGDLTFVFGAGGAHAAKSCFKQSKDDFIIEDRDVTSYYPSLVLNYNIKPRHMSDSFIESYKLLVNDRKSAKANGDNFVANALKTPINSIFGKFNNVSFNNKTVDYCSWVYDWQALLKVTLNGQFILAYLAEQYILNGIEVLSLNTDGILIRYNIKNKELINKIDKEWQNKFNLQLEYSKISKIFQPDVNNYIAIKENGDVKDKGKFSKGSSNTAPIISETCIEVLKNNVNINDYIRNTKDFSKFLNIVGMKKPYEAIFSEIKNVKKLKNVINKNTGLQESREVIVETYDYNTIKKIGKVIRYYNSINGKTIYKKNYDKKEDNNVNLNIESPMKLPRAEHTTIVKRFTNEIPKDLDYEFYIYMVKNFLSLKKVAFNYKINNKQQTLL